MSVENPHKIDTAKLDSIIEPKASKGSGRVQILA